MWNFKVCIYLFILKNKQKCPAHSIQFIWHTLYVSEFCCVSSVPASCVHIWFVSCPRQMWLLVNSCPAVFVSLSIINLCIYSPVCSLWFRLVYSLLPVFPVCKPCLVLPCLALMSLLNNIIWVYVLVCVFLYPPCCVHHDNMLYITSMIAV